MPGPPQFLILDACVLIDYLEADRFVFVVIRDHIGPISVVRPVFEEAFDLSEEEALELGLQIVDPDASLALEAGSERGALSFEDKLCLLLAREEGWTCVTSDRALRKACLEEGVEVRWSLELLLDLVRVGGLGKAEAEAIARAIHEQNPHYIRASILERFLEKLGVP